MPSVSSTLSRVSILASYLLSFTVKERKLRIETGYGVEGILPDGVVQGINYFGNIRYDGPCPEPGARHDYLLQVHALGEPLGLPDGTPADEMIDAIEARSIETITIVGTYRR